MKYLIWSNENRSWWAEPARGYTLSFDAAGRYNRKQAIAICQTWVDGREPDEVPVLESDAIKCRFAVGRK